MTDTKDDAGNDPLVALWGKWIDLRDYVEPEGISVAESIDYCDNMTGKMIATEVEILSTSAKTMAGARVQIALLAWLGFQDSIIDALKPHLQRLAGEAGA